MCSYAYVISQHRTILWKVLEHLSTCFSGIEDAFPPMDSKEHSFLTFQLETPLKGRHVSLSFHFKNHKESLQSWI